MIHRNAFTVKKELAKNAVKQEKKRGKSRRKKDLTNRGGTLIIPTQNKEGTASPTSPGAAGGRGQDGLKL